LRTSALDYSSILEEFLEKVKKLEMIEKKTKQENLKHLIIRKIRLTK
jgi:hypothetical protein